MKKDDYSRPAPAPFPKDLAVLIARRASVMAQRLEDQAIKQMVREARRALDTGMTVIQIAREMNLK